MSFNNSKKYIFSKGLDDYFTGISKAWRFTALFFKEVFKKPFHLREVINWKNLGQHRGCHL
jgi:phospholipid/cholesterol/gamma-HCH transport system permease protein